MKLVVDANIFISALIGGKAAELLFNPNFELLTTERTTWEVKKYAIPTKKYPFACPFALRNACPMKCLPREISVVLISLGHSLFPQGGTYSSGVAPAAGTEDCPVKFCKNSTANSTGACPLPRCAPLNTCPVKFRKNERCGFIGVSWKWSSAYLIRLNAEPRTLKIEA